MSTQNLASSERGEVLTSVEADGTAQRAQSAFELASSAQARADQAYDQGVLAEQRADTAILDAAAAHSLASLALDTAATEEKVSTAGDTMTGYLTLLGDPILPLHASTKSYVDATVDASTSNFLPASDIYTRAHIDETFLPKSAPVVTGGPLTLAQDGTSDLHATTLQQVVALLNAVLRPGFVVMWAGALADIPPGWALCDGTNGTPDLRDRFIIGAGGTHAVGSMGGSLTHTHTITVDPHQLSLAQIPSHDHPVSDPGHNHTVNDPGHRHQAQRYAVFRSERSGTVFAVDSWGSITWDWTTFATTGIWLSGATTGITIGARGGNQAHGHTATASLGNHVPPYVALYFIMRIA